MTAALLAKTTPLHLVQVKNLPIFEQLQLEEALLRADKRNWCLINHGSPHAIVMGISGKPELLLNQQLLEKSPVPVIRRFSGGGTVFIDSQTYFITWICNADDSGVSCCPCNLHQWTASFYKQAFPHLNMQLIENDYVIGKHKFGGNAQYLCKGRWLHHSSLLWDFQSENMQYLQLPAKIPSYREKRSHDDFLCRLKNYFESSEDMQEQLLSQIQDSFDVKHISLEEVRDVLTAPHRKATESIAFIVS